MASRKTVKTKHLLAKVADKKAPCAFCLRTVDEETVYGKLYSIGEINCHYFCVLLSCCLIQKGRDEDGLFGFLYPDILAEIERSKKHKCSYCAREGATLGCTVSQCRKQFHLPCGRERNAVSLFHGNYKSFCQDHAPRQKIPDSIMAKAKVRRTDSRKKRSKGRNLTAVKEEIKLETESTETEPVAVCVICYEPVDGFPSTQTFWPPCCARDAWFHRSCLERMALSAGVHYLKCPLCNDKEQFYKAVMSQGYYVPDRDAAWELEQNAFADMYERPLECRAEPCLCPRGRDYDADTGSWDIKPCALCGGAGAHVACAAPPHVCTTCAPAAPAPDQLRAIHAVSLPSAAQNTQRSSGVIMPCRMSLRRTKQNVSYNRPSSSTHNTVAVKIEPTDQDQTGRQELNLKTPKRRPILEPLTLKNIENNILSPLKLLEQGLYEKTAHIASENLVLDPNIVLAEIRQRFRKPKPLAVKKKIVNNLLEELINNILSKDNNKVKEPIKQWNSPKKIVGVIKNNGENIEIDVETSQITEESKEKKNTQNQEILKQDNYNQSDKEQNLNLLKDDKTTNESPIKTEIHDDSSNSTFELPPEFIADTNSNESLPIFDTPKKLTTVNIQNDSAMEISENNEIINIDLVKIEKQKSHNDLLKDIPQKIPVKTEKCAFKFSPLDKETLEKNKVDLVDVECFKNQYLNEVDKEFNCKFKHPHSETKSSGNRLKTAIDFAMEAINKTGVKRKLPMDDCVASKKIKATKKEAKSIKSKKKKRQKLRKSDTEVSISNKNIKVQIKFRNDKEFKLKISNSKKKKLKKSKKTKPKVLKQYVLQLPQSSDLDESKMIARPDTDVSPLKRKYVKSEKSPDNNLKQTSIQSFFKLQTRS